MNRQAGISLIEVLIAILVLAIGLLGIAGLQSAAMTGNLTSYQYTQAGMLAQSMAERMRANRAAVLNGLYKLTAGTAPTAPANNCLTATCSQADQAQWDMGVLYSQVTGQAIGTGSKVPLLTPSDSSGNAIAALPGGNAAISCPAFPINEVGSCVITIYWDIDRTAPSSYNCSSGGCFQLAFQP